MHAVDNSSDEERADDPGEHACAAHVSDVGVGEAVVLDEGAEDGTEGLLDGEAEVEGDGEVPEVGLGDELF